MTTALDRFLKLFAIEGVRVRQTFNPLPPTYAPHVQPATQLSVGQTHFMFNRDGNYLGLEWDEMCTWEPKGK